MNRFSRSICSGLVLFGLCLTATATSVAAQTPKNGQFKPIPSNIFTLELENGSVQCARRKNNGPFISVRKVKGGQVEPLAQYLKVLRQQLKQAKGNKRKSKKIAKRIAETRNLIAIAKPLCLLGPAASLSPIAQTTVASGTGVAPVAITLNAVSNRPDAEVECKILEVPSAVIVEMVQGCNILVRPTAHLTEQISIKFSAFRPVDNRESEHAFAHITWDQSGDFIGDAGSLAHYRDSLTQTEAMYLVRWAGLGKNAAELVAKAQTPGGLDAVVTDLLTKKSTPECNAVEQAAIESARFNMARRFRTATVNVGGVDTSVNFYGGDSTYNSTNVPTANKVIWTTDAAANYWLYMMRNGCNPLSERVAMIWHNQFALSFSLISNGNFSNLGHQFRHHWLKRHLDWLRGNRAEAGNSQFMRLDKLVAYLHGADGLMLNWLNNDLNSFSVLGGNENYARELAELFTLGPKDIVTGAVNYTEQHIYQMRFALMGYSDDINSSTDQLPDATYELGTFQGCCPMDCGGSECTTCASLPADQRCRADLVYSENEPVFYRNRWNTTNQPTGTLLFEGMPFQKYDVFKANLLGATGDLGRSSHVVNGILQDSGRDLAPIFDPAEDNFTSYLMYGHPGVARYFAARLIATFSSLELTEDLVAPVAKALVDNQYDPTEALRLILTSSAFFAAENQNDGAANAVERIISFLTLLDLPLQRFESGNMQYNLTDIVKNLVWESGYRMTAFPSVFGIEETGKIVGNSVRDGRTFLSPQQKLNFSKRVIDYVNSLNAVITANATSFKWSDLLPSARPTPDQVIVHLTVKLGVELTTEQYNMLHEYLTHVSTSNKTVNGLQVPDFDKVYAVNWSTLSDAKFQELWIQKAPGIVSLLTTLHQVTLR